MTTKHERKLLATVARTQCQGSLQYQELLFYYHHRATGFALKFDDDDDDRSIDPSSRYDTLQGVIDVRRKKSCVMTCHDCLYTVQYNTVQSLES